MRGNVKPRAVSAAEYASLAADCDRWGLSQDADAMRAKAREAVVRDLKESAIEAARRAGTKLA